MFISTCDIKESYSILDAIFVLSASEVRLFDGPNIDAAFNAAKNKLLQKCKDLGGDGVIGCRFEHRSAQSGGLMPKLVIEFFCTGTIIKLR